MSINVTLRCAVCGEPCTIETGFHGFFSKDWSRIVHPRCKGGKLKRERAS